MMKNNSLDDIVKCKIDISSPVSNDATFNSILLVVPEPEVIGAKSITKAIAISKADELLDYGFTIEDAAYIAAEVAFSQNPSPDEVYVCIRKRTEEGDRIGYEPIQSTLARANAEVPFYGIHITEFRSTEDVKAAITWAEANEKIFAFEYDEYAACPVDNFSYYRSFGVYAGDADGYEANAQPAENQYAALAWMAKCFGYEPGTETWNLKELSSIVPSTLNKEQKKKLEEDHINLFLRYAGANVMIGGYMLSGEWIDVIRFRDWLKAEMQNRVFQALKTNRKIPFTDHGIGLIEGIMEGTLKDAQDIGGIAPTEYDKDDNEIPGFQVFVPKAADLTEAEKKARKLTGCKYTARLAGAIHAVEIEGFLTF